MGSEIISMATPSGVTNASSSLTSCTELDESTDALENHLSSSTTSQSMSSKTIPITSVKPSNIPTSSTPKFTPAPYGTRSRNRPASSRPNYAETTEIDLEFDTHVSLPSSIPPPNPSSTPLPPRSSSAVLPSCQITTTTTSCAPFTSDLCSVNARRQTTLFSFNKCSRKLLQDKLIADCGTTFTVDDYVYLICEPPGEPYYIGRIMEFRHEDSDNRDSRVESLRMNWVYRPRDIQRVGNDSRLVYATMHSDICPLASLRGKCNVVHRSEITDLDAYRKQKDSFWFNQLFDRFIHRCYEVIPTWQVINVPAPVKSALDLNWRYVVVEASRVKELTSAAKTCKRCAQYCAIDDSVDCAVCETTYHMNCVRPPLVKKPSRGFAWACGPCSRAQERRIREARGSTPLTGPDCETTFDDTEDRTHDDDDDPDFNWNVKKVLEEDDPTLNLIDEPNTMHSEIAHAKMWPMRYLGLYCKVEAVLEVYDRAIYPRASSRIGARHQANVSAWVEGANDPVKSTFEGKKRSTRVANLKRDAGSSFMDNDRASPTYTGSGKSKRSKVSSDTGIGEYIIRGQDFPNTQAESSATLLWRPSWWSTGCDSLSSPHPQKADTEDKLSKFLKQAYEIGERKGFESYSVDFLDWLLHTLYTQDYSIDNTLHILEATNLSQIIWDPRTVLTLQEKELFEQGVRLHGSELRSVRIHSGIEKHSDVVRYYYIWKKSERGKEIWGGYEGRKSARKRIDNDLRGQGQTLEDLGDDQDDSAYDSQKAAEKKRSFHCKYCGTKRSSKWRRAPGGTSGWGESKITTAPRTGSTSITALCDRCAYLWRRYAIQWGDCDEVAKKISQGGGRKAWKRRIDEELLCEWKLAREKLIVSESDSDDDYSQLANDDGINNETLKTKDGDSRARKNRLRKLRRKQNKMRMRNMDMMNVMRKVSMKMGIELDGDIDSNTCTKDLVVATSAPIAPIATDIACVGDGDDDDVNTFDTKEYDIKAKPDVKDKDKDSKEVKVRSRVRDRISDKSNKEKAVKSTKDVKESRSGRLSKGKDTRDKESLVSEPGKVTGEIRPRRRRKCNDNCLDGPITDKECNVTRDTLETAAVDGEDEDDADEEKTLGDTCVICQSSRADVRGHWALKCRTCGLTVHASCYGSNGGDIPCKSDDESSVLDEIEPSSSVGLNDNFKREKYSNWWYCDVCSNQDSQRDSTFLDYRCVLCPVYNHDTVVNLANQTGDWGNSWKSAIKRTVENNWVHVTCSIWTPEIRFKNASKLELAEGMGLIPAERFLARCSLCLASGQGACVECGVCKETFHIGCAIEAGYLLGFSIETSHQMIKGSKNIVTMGVKTTRDLPEKLRPFAQRGGYSHARRDLKKSKSCAKRSEIKKSGDDGSGEIIATEDDDELVNRNSDGQINRENFYNQIRIGSRETGIASATIICKNHDIRTFGLHPPFEPCERIESLSSYGFLSALQVFVEVYKQADRSVTDTARRAKLLDEAVKMYAEFDGVKRETDDLRHVLTKPFECDGQSTNLKVEDSLAPRDEYYEFNQLKSSPKSQFLQRHCANCGINVSPFWTPLSKSDWENLPQSCGDGQSSYRPGSSTFTIDFVDLVNPTSSSKPVSKVSVSESNSKSDVKTKSAMSLASLLTPDEPLDLPKSPAISVPRIRGNFDQIVRDDLPPESPVQPGFLCVQCTWKRSQGKPLDKSASLTPAVPKGNGISESLGPDKSIRVNSLSSCSGENNQKYKQEENEIDREQDHDKRNQHHQIHDSVCDLRNIPDGNSPPSISSSHPIAKSSILPKIPTASTSSSLSLLLSHSPPKSTIPLSHDTSLRRSHHSHVPHPQYTLPSYPAQSQPYTQTLPSFHSATPTGHNLQPTTQLHRSHSQSHAHSRSHSHSHGHIQHSHSQAQTQSNTHSHGIDHPNTHNIHSHLYNLGHHQTVANHRTFTYSCPSPRSPSPSAQLVQNSNSSIHDHNQIMGPQKFPHQQAISRQLDYQTSPNSSPSNLSNIPPPAHQSSSAIYLRPISYPTSSYTTAISGVSHPSKYHSSPSVVYSPPHSLPFLNRPSSTAHATLIRNSNSTERSNDNCISTTSSITVNANTINTTHANACGTSYGGCSSNILSSSGYPTMTNMTLPPLVTVNRGRLSITPSISTTSPLPAVTMPSHSLPMSGASINHPPETVTRAYPCDQLLSLHPANRALLASSSSSSTLSSLSTSLPGNNVNSTPPLAAPHENRSRQAGASANPCVRNLLS